MTKEEETESEGTVIRLDSNFEHAETLSNTSYLICGGSKEVEFLRAERVTDKDGNRTFPSIEIKDILFIAGFLRDLQKICTIEDFIRLSNAILAEHYNKRYVSLDRFFELQDIVMKTGICPECGKKAILLFPGGKVNSCCTNCGWSLVFDLAEKEGYYECKIGVAWRR